MSGRVVVVGSLNADLVVEVDRRPEPGETVLGGDLAERPGGKGANQAVAAARVGGDVAMLGRVGDDARGEMLRAGLRRAGVDESGVLVTAAAPSGAALITVTDDGENAIVVAPGANARLTAEDIERSEAVVRDAAVVVCQLEIPLEAVEAAARVASGTFVLNAAPARSLSAGLLARTDVLSVNEVELRAVAEATGAGAGEPAALARAVLERGGPGAVMATLGARGALLAVGGEVSMIAAPRTDVVDTTGAGDASVGALGAALAAGLPMHEAARVAVAAGSAAVGAPGAQPELPALAELD